MNFIRFVKENIFPLMWLTFFAFLLFQHRSVFMGFDDFGYATLTYGHYNNPKGMDWNIVDLLDFLKWHYFNWGGRVVPFFFAALVFSCGELFVQMFQSFVVFTIIFFSYRLIKRFERDSFAALLLIVSYCALNLGPLSGGLFWYTAAAVYVWPLLFLFGGLLVLAENPDRPVNIFLSAAILFFAACSHEQIAVLTLVTTAVFSILNFRENHKLNKLHFVIYVAVIIGSALEIFAPGNFIRAASPANAAFYSSSMSDKINSNLPIMLNIIFNSKLEDCIFTIMLFIVGVKIFPLERSKSKFIMLMTLNAAATMLLYVSYGHIFEPDSQVQALIRLVFVTVLLVELSMWFVRQKKYIFAGLLQGAVCSQAMLIMSPAIASRSILPFLWIMNLMFAFVFVQAVSDRKILNIGIYVLTVAVSVSAFSNILKITAGYYGNYFINKLNRYKLAESSSLIAAGQKVQAVILYRLPDDRYSSLMPYRREYSAPWVKTYFGIPQEIPLIWNNFGELSDVYEDVKVEAPVIEDIVIGEMNPESGLRIFVTPKRKGTVPLNIMINGKDLDTSRDNEKLSAYVPRDCLNVTLNVQIKNPVTNLTSEIVPFYLDRNFLK